LIGTGDVSTVETDNATAAADLVAADNAQSSDRESMAKRIPAADQVMVLIEEKQDRYYKL